MQDTKSDRELAARAIGGDQGAWREIYVETCDRLFAFLCYQVANRDDALDLLQETYLYAFDRLDDYRGQGPLAGWLWTIALRKSLNWKRSLFRRMKRAASYREETLPQEDRDSTLSALSTREEFSRALRSLTPNQRATLLLREWENWGDDQIADALQVKESTVRVHLANARERMRRFLTDDPTCIEAKGLEGQAL